MPGPVSPTPEKRRGRRTSRPDLQSQSFSRGYGSILPTSLICVVLFDQRLLTSETCCGYRYGPAPRAKFSLGFSRVGGHAPDAPNEAGHSASRSTLSPGEPIPGSFGLSRRKDNSPRDGRRRPRARPRRRLHRSPGPGIFAWFPFGKGSRSDGKTTRSSLLMGLTHALGPTDSRPTAVLAKPFSASAHKVLACVFATTTKICTRGRYSSRHRAGCFATSAPSYSSKRRKALTAKHERHA